MKNLKVLATFINELMSNFNTYNLVKKSKPVQDISLVYIPHSFTRSGRTTKCPTIFDL